MPRPGISSLPIKRLAQTRSTSQSGLHAIEPLYAEKLEGVSKGLPRRSDERKAAFSELLALEHLNRVVESIELVRDLVSEVGHRVNMIRSSDVPSRPGEAGKDSNQLTFVWMR